MKHFAINTTNRLPIATSKRRSGYAAEELEYQRLNQLIFEMRVDHIIGTDVQLIASDCTCKYQSSDQTLRNKNGDVVTPAEGDRIEIIGLDALTDDLDLSAYDYLKVWSTVSIDNSTYSLLFGDHCELDLLVDDLENVDSGSLRRAIFNNSDAQQSPVGSIIGIHPSVDESKVINPKFYHHCDGVGTFKFTYADGSESADINVPDLTDNRFLMGGTAYGVGGSNTALIAHTHTGPSHTHTSAAHTHPVDPPNQVSGNDSRTHTHTYQGNALSKYTGAWSYGTSPANQCIGYANKASGGRSVSHTHSTNIPSFTSGSRTPGATGASGTAATGSTGSGTSSLPQYFTVKYFMRIQ